MSKEKINKLEQRLKLVERSMENADGRKRIELAEATFKTVLDADYHLDDKASRILSAMAFFTAAAAAIFAKAYSPMLSQDELHLRIGKALAPFASQGAPTNPTVIESVINGLGTPSVQLFGCDLSLIAFLGYMIFAVIAAGFYLAALGPSLNKPSKWQASAETISSRLFYDHIAQVNKDVWSNLWKSEMTPIAALQGEFENNYVYESHLLAEKARAKYLWLSFGGLFLRLALLCLIVLAASLFASRTQTVGLFSVAGCASLCAVFVFQNLTKTPKRKSGEPLGVWTTSLILATLLLLSYFVLIAVNAKLKAFFSAASFAVALVTLSTFLTQVRRSPICVPCLALLVSGTIILFLVGLGILLYY